MGVGDILQGGIEDATAYIIIIIGSFYSSWSTGHPWRASRHYDILQPSPWLHSMSFLYLLFNPILVVHFMPKGLPLESVRVLLISVSLIIIFKVCGLLAYIALSQWWDCHLSLWTSWFSVGASSPSLWSPPFVTRQWCWFWSTLGILFLKCPPYLVSLPLSLTWGGARWKTSNSSRATAYIEERKHTTQAHLNLCTNGRR